MEIKVINKSTNPLPTYERDGDAGMDLRADIASVNSEYLFGAELLTSDGENKNLILYPGGRALIPTSLHMEIPRGYWVGVCSRSGLSLKKGIIVTNSIGIIDSNYRGSVGVILQNLSTSDFVINQGDRVAQAILFKSEPIEWKEVEELSDTNRSEAGYGSSGVE